jgi:hypothetical protein
VKPRPWDSTHPHNFSFKNPEDRIPELETQLQEVVDFLRLRFPKAYDAFLAERNAAQPQKRKRGPKPTPSDEDLLVRRHKLIWFLEQYWPELLTGLKKKNSEETIRTTLQHFTEARYGPHVLHAQYLLDRLPALMDFIRSRDYTGDPRQIAAALAGVPELAWATSQRRCRKIPCDTAIGIRALRDYLRRNFPASHAKLLNAKDTDSVVRAMVETRTNDREFLWMSENPEFALHVMEQGCPTRV